MKKRSHPEKTSRDNPEWTTAMLAKARPAREVLPKIFGARTAAAMLKPRGRSMASVVIGLYFQGS